VSRDFPSSTVMTPSLPTCSIASAIMSPTSESPFEATHPTWAISFLPFTGIDILSSSPMMAPTALSMPRLSAMELAPAVTFFSPSSKSASASTVAVVVPSPAMSEVFDATCFTICTPMFSYFSSSSISLATVTPSLVTVGAPKDFSITTLRPRGPRVTLTARASFLTPSRIASRASWSNASFLAAILTHLPRGASGRP